MTYPSVRRSQERYWERKSQGICVYGACRLPSFNGLVYCEAHRKERRNFDKTRCQEDKKKRNAYHLRWHHKNKEKITAQMREHRQKIKQEVMNHYGGACKCCGEKELAFLDLDHVNNDGAKDRKENPGRAGYMLYIWLRRNSYPEGFQPLCKNCNWAKYTLGACPHERRITSPASIQTHS